jgi:hypothetical protein
MYHKFAENNNLVPAQPATKSEGVPTNNKKVEVHDATEKTTDVTPKQTETEHEKQVLTGTLAQKAAQVKDLLNKQAENFRAFQPPKPGTPFRIVDRSAAGPKNDVPSWNNLPGNRPAPQLPAAKAPPMASVPQQTQPPMVSIPQRAATGGAYPPISPAGSNNNAASPMASYNPPMPASTSRRFAPALTLENILPGSGMSPVRKAIEGATSGVVADSPQGSMWNQLRSDIGSAGLNKAPNPTAFGKNIFNKMQ